MSFKIRTIHDTVQEAHTQFIGIDDFDNISFDATKLHHYYCVATVKNSKGQYIGRPTLSFNKTSAFNNGMANTFGVHKDDVFELPSVSMYLALGKSLRDNCLIYNKKKCRFQRKTIK